MLLDESKQPQTEKGDNPVLWKHDQAKGKKVVVSVAKRLAKKDSEIASLKEQIKSLQEDKKSIMGELKALGIKSKNFMFAYNRRDMKEETRQEDDEQQSFCCGALDVQMDMFPGDEQTTH